ncbi:hypothetical protein GDO86_014874 [Hymenochirus boettgeri]|uniref:Uncharacterized protein n=1 Tax=Hymenochirus boettgeri TaxID=247094 RepID=A0A8T2JYW9_9PIPI|nr:hypothetical protein GDO86_014874 [Hymenochirus boettgeri]
MGSRKRRESAPTENLPKDPTWHIECPRMPSSVRQPKQLFPNSPFPEDFSIMATVKAQKGSQYFSSPSTMSKELSKLDWSWAGLLCSSMKTIMENQALMISPL